MDPSKKTNGWKRCFACSFHALFTKRDIMRRRSLTRHSSRPRRSDRRFGLALGAPRRLSLRVDFLEGSKIIELAKQIAFDAHRGQVRKDGKSYIEHLKLVVSQLAGDEDAQVIGWLHDVLEDTALTSEKLLALGVSKEHVEAIYRLTMRREQRYHDYIEEIKKSELARKVKIADIIANLLDNPGRRQIIKLSKALISLCS